jgi:hypothetical protein
LLHVDVAKINFFIHFAILYTVKKRYQEKAEQAETALKSWGEAVFLRYITTKKPRPREETRL